MRTQRELVDRLSGYESPTLIYDPDVGYIVWHFTTGDNLEVLFIEAKEPGKGQGIQLYKRMIKVIEKTKRLPYHSVVGYRRSQNELAQRFYAKMGFIQVDLGQSIYREGGTTLMWITWADLKKNLEAL